MADVRAWRHIVVEAPVIVASILLAFAVDAWWEGRQETALERHYLQQIAADLERTVDQLRGYAEFTGDRTDAAYRAYDHLSGSPEDVDREELSILLSLATQRRTIELVSAAYTELLSSGRLRLIRDADLRTRIVRFYQSAEVEYEVMEKNDALYVDQLTVQAVFGEGLVRGSLPGFVTDFDSRGYQEPEDRVWELPDESQEIARLRSALWMRAGVGRFNVDRHAQSLIERAQVLQRSIRTELESRWGLF